jgi:hypothetical protein
MQLFPGRRKFSVYGCNLLSFHANVFRRTGSEGINTECLALSGNEIKHYISRLKANIKLCANSFSVVTLPVSPRMVKAIF